MSTPGCAGDRLADHRAGPGDEVEDAGGEAGGLDHLGEDEGVERHHLARLQHHRAAGRQRRRHLGGDLVERVVPGGDRAEHADRLAQHPRVADLLLPGDLLHQLRHRRELAGRQAGLDDLAQLQRHPQLLGDRRGDLLGALAEPGGDRGQVAGALLARGPRPRVEGVPRGPHRPVGVLGRARRDRPHRLLGGRVDDLDRLRPGRVHPLPPDEDLVADLKLCCRRHLVPPGVGDRRTGLAARPTLALRRRRRALGESPRGAGRVGVRKSTLWMNLHDPRRLSRAYADSRRASSTRRRTPKPLASLPVYSRPTSQAVPAMSTWAQGVSPTNSSRKEPA